MPARKKPELYCPNDSDIKTLLECIEGTELELAVLLAAFGPLRRGEICALTDKDIKGNTITVNKSMVEGPDCVWSIKQPKTYGSYRTLELPDFVIAKLRGKKGKIFESTPDQISNSFKKGKFKGQTASLFALSRFKTLLSVHYACHRRSGSVHPTARRMGF